MPVPAHAPDHHPDIAPEKIGVLLLNLGTPEGTDYLSMRKYLSEFLSDRRVIDYSPLIWQPLLQGIILSTRPSKSGAAYRKIWNTEDDESPLKTYTRSQCEALGQHFRNENVIFEWAMRYGHPSTRVGLDNLMAQGCRRILLFALYPQYSAPTTATAYDKAFARLQGRDIKWQPALRTACDWHDDPGYIRILAASVRDQLAALDSTPEHLIASFHGLPERYLKDGDPYHCLCRKTGRLLREALDWPEDKFTTCFQSRFGPEEWLKPYTDEKVQELARNGVKHLAIISPAFVSECVETLEEIDIGLRETFLEAGGESFTYIPCLNDRADHIDFLAGRIRQELAGWL